MTPEKEAEIFDCLNTNVGYQHWEAFDDYFQECADICSTVFGIVPDKLMAYCQENWDERD